MITPLSPLPRPGHLYFLRVLEDFTRLVHSLPLKASNFPGLGVPAFFDRQFLGSDPQFFSFQSSLFLTDGGAALPAEVSKIQCPLLLSSLLPPYRHRPKSLSVPLIFRFAFFLEVVIRRSPEVIGLKAL